MIKEILYALGAIILASLGLFLFGGGTVWGVQLILQIVGTVTVLVFAYKSIKGLS